MANLHDCLQRAVDAGELDQGRADAAKSEFDQLVERYSQAMPRHQAEATAAQHLKQATQRASRSRRHAVLNQLQSMVRLRHLMTTSPKPDMALKGLIEHAEGSGFTGESIRSLKEAYIHSINAGLKDVLQRTGRNMAGNSRDPILLRDLVRELHGEATGNAGAADLAKAVRHQQKRMRQQFNAYGGDIGELADYGLPHSHDTAKLRRTGFDAWAREIAPRLDWNRIIDRASDQPFAAHGARPDPAREQAFLRDIFDGIVSRGFDHREASMVVGGKALYSRRAEARVLHFRDGSSWLEYNRAFGTSDPFSAMIGGLHGMARDVAQMRVLGPNPRMGMEYATQVAQKQAQKQALTSGDYAAAARIEKAGKRAKTMLAQIDGSVNEVYSEGWARFMVDTRNVIASTQLGSAMASSVSDIQTISTAARVMGMNPNNTLERSVKLMSSKATRETAAQMGYVADTLAWAGSTSARFTGDVIASDWSERLTSITLRASGLSFWTDMNRVSFQMEMAGFMAENAARSFDAIDAPLRKMLGARGITAADWDLLRAPNALFRSPDGAGFLTPMHWLEHQTAVPRAEAEGLAMRLQMAVEEQVEIAIPTVSIEARAAIQDIVPAGSFLGELTRSGLMYKNFVMSLTINQYRRFMALPSLSSRLAYGARMSAGLLLFGALGMQLKELAKGNDPRPMTEMKFWMAAAFQGGGLGIFGDFFFAASSRAGGGIAETLTGPVVGLVSDIAKPLARNVTAALQGKDTTVGRDLSKFVRRNTPVASSLWYARVAYDRLVADTLQSYLDPGAETAWKRQMRQHERDYGTRPWWKRGASGPDRFPDISNAAGGQP